MKKWIKSCLSKEFGNWGVRRGFEKVNYKDNPFLLLSKILKKIQN